MRPVRGCGPIGDDAAANAMGVVVADKGGGFPRAAGAVVVVDQLRALRAIAEPRGVQDSPPYLEGPSPASRTVGRIVSAHK